MIRLKDLLFEAVAMDLPAAQKLAKRISKEVNAPIVYAYVSTLGSQAKPSVMVRVSLDEKNTWPNKIYENSRYTMWHISYDGVIEQHNKSHKIPKKFRKTRFTTADEVIKKLNIYIKQVQ